MYFYKQQKKQGEKKSISNEAHKEKESAPLTIQSATPACSGHPNLSGPSSSCKRWGNPGCREVRRDSVTGQPLCAQL